MKKILFITFLLFNLSIAYSFKEHPIKLTSSEIRYDEKKKSIKIECKLFIDDFAPVVSSTLIRNLNQSKLTKDDLRRIENYFIAKYKIAINGKTLSWKIKSYDIASNILTLIFINDDIKIQKGDDLVIENTLLFEVFGDIQSNWMTMRFPPHLRRYTFESKIEKYYYSHTF